MDSDGLYKSYYVISETGDPNFYRHGVYPTTSANLVCKVVLIAICMYIASKVVIKVTFSNVSVKYNFTIET